MLYEFLPPTWELCQYKRCPGSRGLRLLGILFDLFQTRSVPKERMVEFLTSRDPHYRRAVEQVVEQLCRRVPRANKIRHDPRLPEAFSEPLRIGAITQRKQNLRDAESERLSFARMWIGPPT